MRESLPGTFENLLFARHACSNSDIFYDLCVVYLCFST